MNSTTRNLISSISTRIKKRKWELVLGDSHVAIFHRDSGTPVLTRRFSAGELNTALGFIEGFLIGAETGKPKKKAA